MDKKFKTPIAIEDLDGNWWQAYGTFIDSYVIGWMVNHTNTGMLVRTIDPSNGEHIAIFCKDFTFEGKGLMTRVQFEQ